MNRTYVEQQGRAGAKIIDRKDEWIYCKALNSFGLYVMNGDISVTPHLIQEGYWESWITSWLMERINDKTVFYDIGANTGYYSFLAARLGARVRAFEPNPPYYSMVTASQKRAKIPLTQMRIHNIALSDSNGVAELYVPRHLHGSASFSEISEIHRPDVIEVETVRLDDHHEPWEGHHIIKIDAEGAEEKIWDGMQGFIKKLDERPYILLEYTPGSYSPDFLNKLEQYSGVINWINFDGQTEAVSKEWIEAQTDWVMLTV